MSGQDSMIMGHPGRISLPYTLQRMLLFVAFPALVVSTLSVAASNSNNFPVFLWFLLWSVLLFVFLLRFPAAERKHLIPFVVLAVLIRLAVAVYFRVLFNDTNGLYYADEFYYYDYSMIIAHRWEKAISWSLLDVFDLVRTRNYGFHISTAFQFMIFEEKLIPIISNIFFDILTALIVYKISSKSFGKAIARLAFILIIFNPHHIYWSAFLLKDVFLAFAIVLFLYKVQDYNQKHSSSSLLIAILSFLVIATLRFYMAFVLILIVGIYSLVNLDYGLLKKLVIGAALSLAVIMLSIYTPLKTTFEEGNTEGWAKTFYSYSNISTDRAQDRRYSSRHVSGYDIRSLSISLSHFLFSPSPLNWSGDGKYQFLGTIYWYFLFPYFIVGNIAILLNKNIRKNEIMIWIFPLLVIAVITLMPGINEHRHRIMMMPIVTIVASIGFTHQMKHKKFILLLSWLIIIVSVVGREILK